MKDSNLQNVSEIQKSPVGQLSKTPKSPVGQKCVSRTESTTFTWPHSTQSDLFNYLKPEQQEFIKPILRVLKKPAQEELCCMLLDYMESGEAIMSSDVVVDGMFNYLTRYNMPESDPSTSSGQVLNKCIIRPLRVYGEHSRIHSKSPMKVGEIINRFFPQLKK